MAKGARGAALQDRLGRSFRRIPAEDVPRVFRLGVSEIAPNPNQPRKHIDAGTLRELASSIERHGLIQPITVKRRDGEHGGYVLVAGERRLRAHQLLGRNEIHAIVTQGNAEEISLIENIQRQDLHPLEEAAAYARMMRDHGWTQEELAEVVGKARPTITNILKLNALADSVKAECSQRDDVSKSLLFEIARQDGVRAQEALWARMREGGTVRDARATGAERAATRSSGPRGGDPLSDFASRGRRFVRELAAAERDADGVDDELRERMAALRRDLEALLAKLRRQASKPRAG